MKNEKVGFNKYRYEKEKEGFVRKILLTTIVLSIYISSFSYALDISTHRAINAYIAQNTLNSFSLDLYLKNQLGMQSGIKESLKSNNESYEAWQWIREGGFYEDKPPWTFPYLRSRNHFHNPINKQGFSGIWGTGFLSGESAILWSQRAIGTQSPYGYYSWLDVRDYYYNALKSTDKTTKDTNFAQTFRGVGQLMHLVQDMSVPEHSRNDGHYLPTYEEYVRDNSTALSAAIQSPFFFNISALSQLSVFPNAPVPIANLFDTNQYDGTNPGITTTPNIGLSEYSNANFVSPQTLFKDFTYPSKNTSVQVVDYDYPDPFNAGNYVKRQYYKKVADGETNGGIGYRLAGVDYLKLYRDATLSPTQNEQIMVIPPMDDYVYADYASLLLPRAVGYSAGLLNYFFRGDVKISDIAEQGSGQSITGLNLKVQNLTPNEEMKDGNVLLAYRYRDIGATTYTYGLSSPLASGNIPYQGNATYNFSFPSTIPANDIQYTLVFKGTLGQEQGAVVGKVFSLPWVEDWELGLTGRHNWTILPPTTSYSVAAGTAPDPSGLAGTVAEFQFTTYDWTFIGGDIPLAWLSLAGTEGPDREISTDEFSRLETAFYIKTRPSEVARNYTPYMLVRLRDPITGGKTSVSMTPCLISVCPSLGTGIWLPISLSLPAGYVVESINIYLYLEIPRGYTIYTELLVDDITIYRR